MPLYLFAASLLALGALVVGTQGHSREWRLPLGLLLISRLLLLGLYVLVPEPSWWLVIASSVLEGLAAFYLIFVVTSSDGTTLRWWRSRIWPSLTVTLLLLFLFLMLPPPAIATTHHLLILLFSLPLVILLADERVGLAHLAPPLSLTSAGLAGLVERVEVSQGLTLLAYSLLLGFVYLKQKPVPPPPEPTSPPLEQPTPPPMSQPSPAPSDEDAASILPIHLRNHYLPIHQAGEVVRGYPIERAIGVGGFSVVYRSKNKAIKQFNPKRHFDDLIDWKSRFEREFRIVRKLKHDHIIEVHGFFYENNTCYIVMPYLPDTLARRLKLDTPIDLPEGLRIMSQICAALAHAHSGQVIHCDIKPGNILFGWHNEVKVTDFGIAHILADADIPRLFTTMNPLGVGTLMYMPPEQLEGERQIPQIDVYSLGALFYRILTGHYYLDFDMSGTIWARSKNISLIFEVEPLIEPLRMFNIPDPLIQITLKALAKKPEARFAHAGEMLAALRQYQISVQADLEAMHEPTQILLPKEIRTMRQHLNPD